MTTIESRIEALEQAIGLITASLSKKQQARLGVVPLDDLKETLKHTAQEAMSFAKRIYGDDTLTVTGSFEHNGKTYRYETTASADDDGAAKSMQQAAIEFVEQRKRQLTQPNVLPTDSLLRMLFQQSPMCYDDCRSAINTIATWLEHRSKGHLGTGTHWAAVLKSEANR
jgi:hypothetical protein